MKVGFTGTRMGMSQQQVHQFVHVILWLRPTEFHHGGAEGADTDAAWMLFGGNRVLSEEPRLHCHPCPCVVATDKTAQWVWHEVFPPLVRNRHIVESADLLIAAPATDKEQQRSGTWATVRCARQKGIPVIMLSRGGT